MRSAKRDEWTKAMAEGIVALQDNNVWNVVKRSPESNALYIKWVYKTNTDPQEKVDRLKARLVACGNAEVLGVDYSLTFAVVMDRSY